MRPLDIAASMSARVPWRVAQKILSVNEIARGRGWDNTLEKLESIKDDPDTEAALEAALVAHYACGEKLVRFYKVSRSNMSALKTTLETKKVPKSNFQERYPLLLDGDELKSEPKKPVLYQGLHFLTHRGFPIGAIGDSLAQGGFAPCQHRLDCGRTFQPPSFEA